MELETLIMSGRFKVLRHIGAGGMAEVYLGEQVSLGRKVALKVLKRDLGKRPDMAERFKREARLLSTVDHPSVVRVIDFESAPEATVLVLELAEGETLDALLKAGPLEPGRAIFLLAQLAEGLSAIHEKGIIHRDLKPSNVVVTPGPRGEQARLLDFGIARLVETLDSITREHSLLEIGGAVQPVDPLVSQPGQVVGTPAFVAPEQATAQPLDARTDVYAFGVLAYRVLAGALPFPGPGAMDFLKQHLTMPPRPLLEAAPHLEASPELVKLVMSCLEKRPEARPASGQALAEALLRLMPLNPLESGVTTPSRRLMAAAQEAASQVAPPIPAAAAPGAARAAAGTPAPRGTTPGAPARTGGAPAGAAAPAALATPSGADGAQAAARGAAGVPRGTASGAGGETAARGAGAPPSRSGGQPSERAGTAGGAGERGASPAGADGAAVEVVPTALRTGLGKVQVAAAQVGAQGLEGARKAVVAAKGMPRDWKRSLLITLGVMLATPLVWAGLPPSRMERIERSLQRARPTEALALIDEGLAEGGGAVPRLLALKVAALHAAGRFPDERALLRAAPYQVTHGAHPLLMEALAEDFAVAEGDQELRELISLVPPQRLQPQLEALAVGPRSLRQWGALRFLDLTGRHGAIDRVGLYASALRSPDCPVREAAAVRLGELHDGSAISALRELSETPKDETPDGRINCGQDEAAEAIRQLRKVDP